MARYTASIGAGGTPDYEFMGWDELTGPCTEATQENVLHEPMTKSTAQIFGDLEPGQAFVAAWGTRYFREW